MCQGTGAICQETGAMCQETRDTLVLSPVIAEKPSNHLRKVMGILDTGDLFNSVRAEVHL